MFVPESFWAAFTQKVRDEVANRQVLLGQGVATSFEDYRKRAGEIAGLEMALSIGDGMLKASTAPRRGGKESAT